jgi:hypothetical protein
MLNNYKLLFCKFLKSLKIFKESAIIVLTKLKLLIQATAVEQAIVAVSAAPKENPL